MTTVNINEEIKKLFGVLANGSRSEVREAKKQIENLWRQNHKDFQKSGGLILKIMEDFDGIPDAEHKAAVISGMNIFYLALADDYFDELKNFIIKNLQHSDGRVRQAALKTGDWLYISLTARTEPFVYPKGKPLSEKQKVEQKIAQKQYADLIKELEDLIDHYDETTENCEYIYEMKPSISKSLQLFWTKFAHYLIYALAPPRRGIGE